MEAIFVMCMYNIFPSKASIKILLIDSHIELEWKLCNYSLKGSRVTSPVDLEVFCQYCVSMEDDTSPIWKGLKYELKKTN